MNELSLLKTWIYQTLSADTVLAGLVTDPVTVTESLPLGDPRVYPGLLPEECEYPAVQFVLHSGKDRVGGFGKRLFAQPVYKIVGICTGGTFDPVATIADRIDELIQGAAQLSGPLIITGCRRLEVVEMDDTDNGIRYNYLGGLYEFTVQPPTGNS